MNTIVIDGYNLIHRVDELLAVAEKEEFESARNELEWTVSSYLAERKGVRAVVVYDSMWSSTTKMARAIGATSSRTQIGCVQAWSLLINVTPKKTRGMMTSEHRR